MSHLINTNPGDRRLLMGNEAIARGALEAGISVAAGYPGTPSSDIIESLACPVCGNPMSWDSKWEAFICNKHGKRAIYEMVSEG